MNDEELAKLAEYIRENTDTLKTILQAFKGLESNQDYLLKLIKEQRDRIISLEAKWN